MITTAHWTKRAPLLLFAVAIAFAVFVTVGAAPVVADDDPDEDRRSGEKLGGRKTLIYDQFSLKREQSRDLDGREPDRASIGTVWEVELGDWHILGRKGGEVVERSLGYWEYVPDKRVNIDAETANLAVSSSIKRGDGYQYFGVTTRHSGPVDWLGAWFDPEGWPSGGPGSGEPCPRGQERCGAILLGAKTQSSNPVPPYHDLRRARYDWREGKKGTISLAVIDDQVEVRVGGKVMIRAEFAGLGDATEVGLFSRGEGETAFENFKASGRVRLKKVKTPKDHDD